MGASSAWPRGAIAQHHHLTVLGDKGYISTPLATTLREQQAISLLTVPYANQAVQLGDEHHRRHNRARQIIEAVNSQLAQQFHLETNHAHSIWGLTARLLTKLTAHTIYAWLDRLLGNPGFLHIKHLAFAI
jgi:hypothetical protein